MNSVVLSLIVAMTRERLIGNHGKLPWNRLPGDLARFKEITMAEGVVVMGCRTYMSILARNSNPLPERKNIVLTRKKLVSGNEAVKFVGSVEEALDGVANLGGRACIIGGAEIYKLFLPLPELKTMYVTIVHASGLMGDAYFPEIGAKGGWSYISHSQIRKWNPKDEYESSYNVYKRS